MGEERKRLEEDAKREQNWKRWGPYLSERQWATVREDYSRNGDAWEYFSHDHARSRVYRWGEDGLLGITDRQCRLCFGLALHNGKDPILKERLFGLTGMQGNHGEDVKELYYYLDATPCATYLKGLYKYPISRYPYERLAEENRKNGRLNPEFELMDTGIFKPSSIPANEVDEGYFDILAEYAKNTPEDILIRISIKNCSNHESKLALLPQIWFRNTWAWGRKGEDMLEMSDRPSMHLDADGHGILCRHPTLGLYRFVWNNEVLINDKATHLDTTVLFTENESNNEKLFNHVNKTRFVKDAFHEYVVNGNEKAVNPAHVGTKAAPLYNISIPERGSVVVTLRLYQIDLPSISPHNFNLNVYNIYPPNRYGVPPSNFGALFERIFTERIAEADKFYESIQSAGLSPAEKIVQRQAYAGLIWSKQFYYYIVQDWFAGDPNHPPPPTDRNNIRNFDWSHLYCRDVISMPDKWEYPWFASWDLAFHMIPFAKIDLQFAKDQLELFLREWYLHPNGALPAYEWEFSDVGPPVHAWSCWRIYKKSGPPGHRDTKFLERVFHKLLLNFTWWVNRKDRYGRHLFAGGFLGLDNIGIFDRSKDLPCGGQLDQADGTAWMAFFCGTMLSISLELSLYNIAYEDMASKFFEHFVAIIDACNHLGGSGLWNEKDGFYYDHLKIKRAHDETCFREIYNTNSDEIYFPIAVRSLVGIIPLIAVEILEQSTIDKLPGFKKRMNWFLANRPDVSQLLGNENRKGHRLLSIASKERLVKVLKYVFDENEFLSEYGIRSLSKFHEKNPYYLRFGNSEFKICYSPGESVDNIYGGNSSWRGPIWFPINFLLIEALERYYHFYGNELQVEFPTNSGRLASFDEIAYELSLRLANLFLPDQTSGQRPCHGADDIYSKDENWKNLILFYEYFDGNTGKGLGASHQTGWTALVASLLEVVGGRSNIYGSPKKKAASCRIPSKMPKPK